MGKLATIRVAIEGNSGKLVKAIKQAEGRLTRFQRNAKQTFATLRRAALGATIIGGAAVAGFAIKAVKNFLDVGESLDKMSQRTGFSVETLGELKFAADQASGVEHRGYREGCQADGLYYLRRQ